MTTQQEYNKAYYQAHREEEKKRKLEHYHQNKHKIDREKQKAYMQEYLKTYKRKPITPEQREERNRKRRERYATDKEYRERERKHAREWTRKNPRKRKAQRLREKYNMELAEFQRMLEAQGGKCAICGYQDRTNRNFFPLVDHCHKTEVVRGILCMNCNQGLGKFGDDPELLTKAVEYLTNGSSGVT